ncbi:MAG: 2-isopropylmalate synthase [Sulfurifustis sp.]
MMTTSNEMLADGTRSTSSEVVRIFDTTLRDGEQSPGATLNADEKLEIAEQLARLGVDIIEAGFPASSPGDLSAVQQIAVSVGRAKRTDKQGAMVDPPAVAAMARASRGDIDQAWRGVRDAKHPRIHIVLATSDIHLEYKLRKTRAEVLDMARQSVTYACRMCNDVEFSPEDATRSDREFLVQVLEAAVEAGATTLNIPDTVGYATPEEYGGLIRFLRERIAKDGVVLSTHCHDDLGLATANTLAGVVNGARQVEVTINGIGERAGNACVAETVMALHTRRSVFNFETNVIRREIYRTSKLVSSLTGMVVQPNKAIVGANAFSHEAGIHQDGVLKNRRTYEIMDAAEVGFGETRLVLGKHSGRNALRSKLEKLGYRVTGEKLDRIFKKFKDVVDTQKTVSDAQLQRFCAELSVSTDDERPNQPHTVNVG